MSHNKHRMGWLVVLGAIGACSSQPVNETANTVTSGATASASPSESAARPAPTQMWVDDSVVLVRKGNEITTYDAAMLAPTWHSDHAVFSADRSVAVSSATSADTTVITVRDIRAGTTRRTFELPSQREVTAVSTHGDLAALVDPQPIDPVTAMPTGRARSNVDVVDLATGALLKEYDLAGNYRPEAFDTNGGLALLAFEPSLAPDRYRVRRLELLSGSLQNVYTREKTEIVDDMQGYGRAAAAPTDGFALFTLYRDASKGDAAFIHELIGQGQFAFCVDLPDSGFGESTALALSPDGRELYVAGADGAVAVLDAHVDLGSDPLVIRKVVHVVGVVGLPLAIAVTDNTLWLLVADRVVQADRTSGAVLRTTDVATDTVSVGATPDAHNVLVSAGARLRRIA